MTDKANAAAQKRRGVNPDGTHGGADETRGEYTPHEHELLRQLRDLAEARAVIEGELSRLAHEPSAERSGSEVGPDTYQDDTGALRSPEGE